jgi:hypothetical protein
MRMYPIDFWNDKRTKLTNYRPCWMLTIPITKAERTIYYFAHGVHPDKICKFRLDSFT